jgi:2,4-dienoyl-CoA reductase-like NADH-dependent reductase (Old Yellow Enzyme family)
MSQYCADGHLPTDWHLAHYITRAIGLGLVIVEATAVSASGAVTPYDLSLWDDRAIEPLARLARGIAARGAVAGIQLSHGGRKASRSRPWDGDEWIRPEQGGWEVYAASSQPFADGYPTPLALDTAGIATVVDDFGSAARRALRAGFTFLELHAGHGRLLHGFLSPLANHRGDAYGGSLENRCRLLLEVATRVRREWPAQLPLAVRLSCVDWVEGGWTLADSVLLAGMLGEVGVDLIDCSSSGIQRPLRVNPTPGYQVPFARAIRRRTGLATAAVGLIQNLWQADQIVADGAADLVLMGRGLLADPLMAMRSVAFGVAPPELLPPQYARATSSQSPLHLPVPDFIPEL